MMEVKTRSFGIAILDFHKYTEGKRTAIRLLDKEDGSTIAMLTTNLPQYKLDEDEFFVKNWSENEELAEDCMASGLFEDTGKRVKTGWVMAPIWRLKK